MGGGKRSFFVIKIVIYYKKKFSSLSTVASGIHKKPSVLSVTDNSGTYTFGYTGTSTQYASTITDSSGLTYSNVYYLKGGNNASLTLTGSGNKKVNFYIVGSGGNGCATTNTTYGGGGGGGGGILIGSYSITKNTTFTIIVAASGGVNSPNTTSSGKSGNYSQVTDGTTTYRANGGSGGDSSVGTISGNATSGGTVGTVSANGTNLNIRGNGSGGTDASGRTSLPLYGGSGQLFYDGKFYGGGGGGGTFFISGISTGSTYGSTNAGTYTWQGKSYDNIIQNSNGTTGNGGLGGGGGGGINGVADSIGGAPNSGGGGGGQRAYTSYAGNVYDTGGTGIIIVYW
jgi:hypothetical protein